MFLLILVVLLYVFVDQQKHTKEPPKSTQTYKRTTKINKNIQKNHQNQHKHTKEPPKSTKTCKRTTKINKNMQKNHQNQLLLILVVLLYVFVDFGGSFVCFC
jgi:ABC-type nickel/cobalt efflux system permease component RcnA